MITLTAVHCFSRQIPPRLKTDLTLTKLKCVLCCTENTAATYLLIKAVVAPKVCAKLHCSFLTLDKLQRACLLLSGERVCVCACVCVVKERLASSALVSYELTGLQSMFRQFGSGLAYLQQSHSGSGDELCLVCLTVRLSSRFVQNY